MKTVINTTFQILKANEEGEMEVLFSEIKRNTVLPFSLKCAFEGMLGQEVKLIRWTEGDNEVMVLGRGGKLK